MWALEEKKFKALPGEKSRELLWYQQVSVPTCTSGTDLPIYVTIPNTDPDPDRTLDPSRIPLLVCLVGGGGHSTRPDRRRLWDQIRRQCTTAVEPLRCGQ